MVISESQSDLEALAKRAEEKERAVWKRTILFTLIPIALAVLLLIFTGMRINQAQKKLTELQGQTQDTQKKLAALEADITKQQEKLKSITGLTQEEIIELIGYGWEKNRFKLSKDIKGMAVQSFEADKELERLSASIDSGKRRTITVAYFPKAPDQLQDADLDKIDQTLRELGFRPQRLMPNPDKRIANTPTNAIFFGRDVPIDDAKLVGYVFIRAGVPIKGIYAKTTGISTIQKSLPKDIDIESAITVVSNIKPKITNRSPLTVEAIKKADHFNRLDD